MYSSVQAGGRKIFHGVPAHETMDSGDQDSLHKMFFSVRRKKFEFFFRIIIFVSVCRTIDPVIEL